jgi:hypothetical protein
MKKIELGDEIFIKNREEADFIWNILINLGYCWNSGKKDFCYYEALPFTIQVIHNKKLMYLGMRKMSWMLTIDDFKYKKTMIDLE